MKVRGANGQRIDPFLHNSDSSPIDLPAEPLNAFSLTYLQVMRAHCKRERIGNTGDTLVEADAATTEGVLDAVAFDTALLAHPDLPERIQAGVELNIPNPAPSGTASPESCNGYPTMRAVTPA